MRIAQVAPPFETVPPRLYGGTERVISTLTEELIDRGHEVTLFACAESVTRGRLVPIVEQAIWRTHGQNPDPTFVTFSMLSAMSEVYRRAAEFDVIHAHTDEWTLPFASVVECPTVLTLHGRLDLDHLSWIYDRLPDAAMVSVSMAQRKSLQVSNVQWFGCVPNGLTLEKYQFEPEPGKYLLFIGRITPEKRPDLAVEVARRLGIPLKVGAAIHSRDQQYWEEQIRPLFDSNDVEFVGEVSDEDKSELYGGALATLFPSDWPEPFGLVMVESMACGTPVVALDRGAVREILVDGVTGIICPDIDAMTDAVRRIDRIDRRACRDAATRFSATRLADDYLEIYRQAIEQRRRGTTPCRLPGAHGMTASWPLHQRRET